MPKYILALDQGTTSSRAIVFDEKGSTIAIAQKEFQQIFPEPGWVEHDAEEIFETQLEVTLEVLQKSKLTATDIAAIGITNQRETTVVWDKDSGKPIYNAIVWQDRRTEAFCKALRKENKDAIVKEKTGLILDAYFSATKIKWILDNVDGAKDKAQKGKLCFGTIDTWLVWKLTGGKAYVTDVTNASRTMLLNIHTLQWDGELQNLFGVPGNMLPEVRSCSEIYGEVDISTALDGIPIAGIAGDQQSALFGQMCIQEGMVKNTYGTGCFMLMNTGTEAKISKNNLLTTVAWKFNDTTHYALEGSVFIAGAVVQWLRDGLGIIEKSADVEALALKVPHTDGVYMVPAFAGLGAPYWNPHARGTVVGLTRGSTAAHIARASLESIAYQSMDLLNAMESDAGVKIKELRVDGGATGNDLLMQFQSNLVNTNVIRPTITETTALGAAYFAGLAVKYWNNLEEIQQQWQVERVFESTMEEEHRTKLVDGWKKAVKAAMLWTEA